MLKNIENVMVGKVKMDKEMEKATGSILVGELKDSFKTKDDVFASEVLEKIRQRKREDEAKTATQINENSYAKMEKMVVEKQQMLVTQHKREVEARAAEITKTANKILKNIPDLSSVVDDFEEKYKPTPNEIAAENKTDWDYIATYVINWNDEKDYEILDFSYITLSGNMDSDIYFSECVANADAHDLLPTDHYGKYTEEYPRGVYRMVFGVKARGESYDTADGVEHDSWEEYDLISKYQFTEKEAEVCFAEIAEEVWFDLEAVDSVYSVP